MAANKRKREVVEWFGGQILLPTYVHEGGAPFRPGGSLWCSSNARQIVGWSPFERDGSLAAVVEHFLQCTRQPMVGAPRMPDRVRVTSAELAAALRSVVPTSVEVQCGPTPEIEEVIQEIATQFEVQEGTETYLSPDIAPSLVACLFRNAARYYRAAPWKVLDGATLLSVSCEPLGLSNAVLACMGNVDESTPGLIYFGSFAEFEANIRAMDGAEGTEPHLRRQVILDYDRGAEVPPSMRKEVVAHQWEVADAHAFPWVAAVDDDGVQRPGTRDELVRMQLLSGAVADLVEKTKRLTKRLASGEPIVHECTIETCDGQRVPITLRVPFEDERVLELNQHLVDDLLDMYDDSPEAAELARPPRFAHLVPELALQEGLALEELTPKVLKALVFEGIAARLPVEPTDARAILEETRAMLKYLHRHEVIPDLDACLAVVDAKKAATLTKALADTSRYEMAKQILLAGKAAGFDMSTEKGVSAYLRSLDQPTKPARKRPSKKSS